MRIRANFQLLDGPRVMKCTERQARIIYICAEKVEVYCGGGQKKGEKDRVKRKLE